MSVQVVAASLALVAEGRRTGRSWCVWCNTKAVDALAHGGCRLALWSSSWRACGECLGGGIDACGGSCEICHGVGFFPADDGAAVRHAHVLGLADGVNW
jgi:hypothetical protein